MKIPLSEHKTISIAYREEAQSEIDGCTIYIDDLSLFNSFKALESQRFNSSSFKYIVEKSENEIKLSSDYCVGIDWLGATNRFVYVEPKVNTSDTYRFENLINETDENINYIYSSEIVELNFLKMLLEVHSGKIYDKYLQDLVSIDWNSKQIPIEQNQDHLTPFLIVEFLQLLKRIVIKGLKKTYYKTNENLTNRVKGKILVAQQIKQNTLKGRLTKTLCQYQVFGEDNSENRFLKKVLSFVTNYVQNNKPLFHENIESVQHLISYSRPSFENIGTEFEAFELKHIKPNPFFKEYAQAIKIGQYILKRFSYNISKTTDKKITTPPFWIDMPRLFELYVYHHLLISNENAKDRILYQFATYGNSLDFLIKDDDNPMIIDTKYKLHYENGHIHQDIRQVSGYARLNKVRDELGITDDSNINCLIIYPDPKGLDLSNSKLEIDSLISESERIEPYYKVFKLGVKLPLQSMKTQTGTLS